MESRNTMRHVWIVAVAVAAFAGSSLLHAESLGEASAREKEKKKGKPEGKVITGDDLGKHRKGTFNGSDDGATTPTDPTAKPKADGTQPADGAAAKEKTPEEVRAEAEKAWRARYDAKTAEMGQIQARISRLEGSRGLYADAQAQADLAAARMELQAAQAALSSLDDERRRAGFAR
jgi:hypothetical protein